MATLVMKKNTFWENKNVLITGHTGFKGSWLMALLHRLGANIYGFSLKPDSSNMLFKEICFENNFKVKSKFEDINNFGELKNFFNFSKPDIVFHLAAQSLVRKSYREPINTWNTNVIGSLNVLEAAKLIDKKVSIVVVTTDKVYENNETGTLYSEEDKLGGHDPYSASKAAVELAIKSWRLSFCGNNPHQTPFLSVVTARAGNVIGGGDWSEDRLVPDSIKSLIKKTPIMIRNPDSTRPWQHVLDPLSGYLLLAENLYKRHNILSPCDENIFASAFNFGPQLNSNKDVKSFVEELLNFWEGEWIDISNKSKFHEAKLLNLSSKKANKILNWTSNWDFKETLFRTVNWYKKNYDGVKALDCCNDDFENFFDI